MRNTYTSVRILHQWAALALASYVAMYTLTGIVLIYPAVVPDRWSVERSVSREIEVSGLPTATGAAEMTEASISAVAEAMASRLGLRGRLDGMEQTAGAWRFTFGRPGTLERVHWTPGDPLVTVEIMGGSLRGMLNRLHHLDGYRGGFRFLVWATLVDLVSLSMFVFAGSGIYMWYVRKKKDRRLGWVILAGSTTFVVFAVVYLVVAK